MFWVRFRSAVVLVIITLAIMIAGGPVLFGVLGAISIIGLNELYKVLDMHKTFLGFVGYLAAIAWYALVYIERTDLALPLFIAYLMALLLTYVFTFPKYNTEKVTLAFFGLIYVAVMLSFIYQIREFNNGIWMVWLVFMGSWISDTCAYCVGVLIGKHKLSPKVSPKKSIEGSLGGIIGSALLGALYAFIVKDKLDMRFNPVLAFAVISGASSIISQLGDLAASAIKRDKDIKDYGTLIPGHGGILDRFDSVIFTAPIVFYLATYFI